MNQTDRQRGILQSAEGRRMLSYVSPIYGDASVALWLFEAMGREFDRLADFAGEYRAQLVPQTATWGLDYWEREYGITRDDTLGIEKRRARVLNAIASRTPINPAALARIASAAAANAEVEIEENTGKNKFTLWVSALPFAVEQAKIEAAVDEAKPAHLIYEVKYVRYGSEELHSGGILQSTRNLTIRQV